MIAETVSAYSLVLANVNGDEIVHTVATVLGPLSAVLPGRQRSSRTDGQPRVAPTASILPSGLKAARPGKPVGQTSVSTGLQVAKSYRTTRAAGVRWPGPGRGRSPWSPTPACRPPRPTGRPG